VVSGLGVEDSGFRSQARDQDGGLEGTVGEYSVPAGFVLALARIWRLVVQIRTIENDDLNASFPQRSRQGAPIYMHIYMYVYIHIYI